MKLINILKSKKSCVFTQKELEKHNSDIRNKAINEFADNMISMMPGHKEDILRISISLKSEVSY